MLWGSLLNSQLLHGGQWGESLQDLRAWHKRRGRAGCHVVGDDLQLSGSRDFPQVSQQGPSQASIIREEQREREGHAFAVSPVLTGGEQRTVNEFRLPGEPCALAVA